MKNLLLIFSLAFSVSSIGSPSIPATRLPSNSKPQFTATVKVLSVNVDRLESCITEAMNDESGYELDESEAQDYCEGIQASEF